MDERRTSSDDTKKEADILLSSFLEAGRACEQYFIQKHIQVSSTTPTVWGIA